jgi:hypothetical protein
MGLVVLRRYLTLSEAYAAAGALRSAGLYPAVFDESFGTVVWTDQYYLGGFRLAVPASEAMLAVDVLKQAYRPAGAPADDDDPDAEIDLRHPLPSLLLVLFALLGGSWTVSAFRFRPTGFRIAVMAIYVVLGSLMWLGLWFQIFRPHPRYLY